MRGASIATESTSPDFVSEGRAGIPLLLALAAGLLAAAWWVAQGTLSPERTLGIENTRATSRETQDLTLARPGAAAEIIGSVERTQVAIGPDRLDAGLWGEAPPVPQEWTLQFRVDRKQLRPPNSYRVGTHRASDAYFAAVFLATGGTVEFGRMDLARGELASLTFERTDFAALIKGASLVLATCPQGVGGAPDVFFDGQHARVGMALDDALHVDLEARTVLLGELALEPIPHLGTLRVDPREDGVAFQAFVSSSPLERRLLGQFGRPTPGRLRAIPSGGATVEAYSFAPGTRWSVLLKADAGDLIESAEEARGEEITIEYERPQGVSLVIDLASYGSAARAVIVSRDVPIEGVLTADEYSVRVQDALATQAIPLPRFRVEGAPFTAEVTGLQDGPLRVELWARSESMEAGSPDSYRWKLLGKRAARVAGDLVEVRF